MPSIRPPAVAGLFYPADPEVLMHDVSAMLSGADEFKVGHPKALIVPHAGYIYSGPVAASGYAALKQVASDIKKVVLLGPTHRVPVHGLAVPGVTAFATPLGEIPLDMEAVERIKHFKQVVVNDAVHAQEHSLEVHLPFLQSLLHEFTLLPLAVGMASPEEVAEVLESVWGGKETLIVISSDLSHYLPYDMARHVDTATTNEILHLQTDIPHDHACGATPVNGLLLLAQRHHLEPRLLDLRNSGDTAGPRDGVVGYAAIAFEDKGAALADNLAREA